MLFPWRSLALPWHGFAPKRPADVVGIRGSWHECFAGRILGRPASSRAPRAVLGTPQPSRQELRHALGRLAPGRVVDAPLPRLAEFAVHVHAGKARIILRLFGAGNGVAFGLDRIIMILTGATSIRDVIAFPKTQKAVCPLTDAPSVVTDKQCKELHIKTVE